jgi:hypothetical protein
LPASIQAEIKALKEKGKPKLQPVKDLDSILKFFHLSKTVKILGFEGKSFGPITVKTFAIAYKEKGDCTNYPDVFLTGKTDHKLEQVSGVVLPEAAQIITDSKEIVQLSKAVSKGLSQVMGPDLAAQAPDSASSSSYFRYQGRVYVISPAILEGGYLGTITDGKYEKLSDLELPTCGT